MPPPDTNLSKQTLRHRPALFSMVIAIVAVGVWLVFAINTGPGDTELAPASEGGAAATSE